MKVHVNNIKVFFKCECCDEQVECTIADLVEVGVPLCELGSEEMELGDYVEVKIKEGDNI